MSDHWKTLARLLGAPGAAEPPKPKPKTPPTASKPAETKAAEIKPAETKPAETEPVVSGGRTPAGERPTNEGLPGSLPGFGPSAAEAADEDEADIFSEFGKPRAAQRSESRASESRAPESRAPESRVPESREAAPPARETGRRGDSRRGETRTPAEKIFSEPIRSEGPSSWDELVDRLGVPAAPSPQPRLSDSEPLETPAQREPAARAERERPQRPSRPKASGGGFGGGLGFDAEPEPAAPEARPERAPQQEWAPQPVSEPETPASVERDPLEELGEFGWGPPRRGRLTAGRREGAEEREERPSRSREEAPREGRGRGEGRPEARRGERSREEPRTREERGARRAEEPVAEKFAAEEAARPEAGRPEAGRGDETSGRPARRGRRRGQRQRLAEDSIGWDEGRTAAVSREQEPVGFGDEDELPVGFVEDELEEEFGVLPEIEEESTAAVGGEEGEPQPRRRRRRGRRRRGGTAEPGAEPTAVPSRGGPASEDRRAAVPSERASVRSAGRAIDSGFDDDHEDDDEAVELRRSRRGRRRRTPVAEADLGAGEDTPRSSNYGAEVDGVEEDEVVLQNTQRNIPTWADTVALLVTPNLESRKREPQRGGGGGGRGRGRRRD